MPSFKIIELFSPWQLFSQFTHMLQVFTINWQYQFSPFIVSNLYWGNQIWPCCKISQGPFRVIIYIHFLELESLMLHAKFQIQRTWFWDFFSSVFHHKRALSPSWSCDLDHLYKPSFHPSQGGSTLNLALTSQVVSEKMFKHYKRTMDARDFEYCKLTLWAWLLRWAKNKADLGHATSVCYCGCM